MSLLKVENGVLDIDNFVEVAHNNAVDKGFWDVRTDEDVPVRVALIHSEASEALEAHRNMVPFEDSVEDFVENFIEELADVVIRVADLAGGLKLDIGAALVTMRRWGMDPNGHGSVPAQIANIHLAISDILQGWLSGCRPPILAVRLAIVLLLTERLAVSQDLDLLGAIQAKVEKNAGRPQMHGKAY